MFEWNNNLDAPFAASGFVGVTNDLNAVTIVVLNDTRIRLLNVYDSYGPGEVATLNMVVFNGSGAVYTNTFFNVVDGDYIYDAPGQKSSANYVNTMIVASVGGVGAIEVEFDVGGLTTNGICNLVLCIIYTSKSSYS